MIPLHLESLTAPLALLQDPAAGFTAETVAARTEARASGDVSGAGNGAAGVRVKDFDLDEVIRELESIDSGRVIEVQKDDEKVSVWIE